MRAAADAIALRAVPGDQHQGRPGRRLPERRARIHDLCRANGIPVWCGGMVETGLGRAANAALAALPGFTLPGDISASDRFYEQDITAAVRAGGRADRGAHRPGPRRRADPGRAGAVHRRHRVAAAVMSVRTRVRGGSRRRPGGAERRRTERRRTVVAASPGAMSQAGPREAASSRRARRGGLLDQALPVADAGGQLGGAGADPAEEPLRTHREMRRRAGNPARSGDRALLVDQPPAGVPVQCVGAQLERAKRHPAM